MLTTNLKKCIVSKEEALDAKFKSSWYILHNVPEILGKEARPQMKKFGPLPSGCKLIDECHYIFYRTCNGYLQPVRVSMHPKTAWNYERRSRRFGSLSILKEVINQPV